MSRNLCKENTEKWFPALHRPQFQCLNFDCIVRYIKCGLRSHDYHLITLRTREQHISLINRFSFYIRIYIPGVYQFLPSFVLLKIYYIFKGVCIQYLFSYVLPKVFSSIKYNSNAMNSKSLNKIVFFHTSVRFMKINFKTKQKIIF